MFLSLNMYGECLAEHFSGLSQRNVFQRNTSAEMTLSYCNGVMLLCKVLNLYLLVLFIRSHLHDYCAHVDVDRAN